jgi:hypothetical protein
MYLSNFNDQTLLKLDYLLATLTYHLPILKRNYPCKKFSARYLFVCLFVCLFIFTRVIFQPSGCCRPCQWQGCKFKPMLGAQQDLWAGGGSLSCHTYCDKGPRFIRKTKTQFPQWDSTSRRNNLQIFAIHALTTAPRGRLHELFL